MQTHQLTFMYSPLNDNVDQSNGRIEVSLLSDTNSLATYTLADNNSVASVIVQDDDVPEISIEGGGDVTEGENAQFIVSSNIAKSKSIDIMYTIVAEFGNFLPASHNVVEKVTLDSGDETDTATIAVATQADEIDEDNGAIEVTLQPDNRDPIQYLVSETAGSGTVDVIDDDLPVISVSSQGKVSEGSGIIFTIRSNIERDHPIRIRYKLVDQAGNIQNRLVEPDSVPFVTTTIQPTISINSFATPSSSSTVLLGAGDSEVTTTVIIPVPQDSTLENFDQLTLTIEPDDSYERSSSAGSETVIIENIVVPVISVQGVGPVNEGEVANFAISADIARNDSITVYYSVSSGLFDTANDRIELAAGDTEIKAHVTVEIPDNEIYEASNFVKVELLDDVGTKYQVNPLLNESSIEVLNNDVPQISITGEGAVTEGENARFIVRANIARQESLIIDYSVSNHSGDFLSPRQPRSDSVVLEAGAVNDTTIIAVETHNDTYIEYDGEVQVTLEASENQTSDYTIDPQQASAIVEVSDDGDTDRPSQVTLALSSEVIEISEGDTIPISITADIDPIMEIQVSYSITNVKGNFYTISNGTQRETNFVTLDFTESSNSDEYIASFLIETRVENGLDEENGSIVVSLNSTADYNISPFEEDSATIAINDVDVPELSIEESVSVTAPDAVVIEIYSDIEPWQPLTVEYTPEIQSGNFLDATAGISGESRTVELEFTESTTLDNWVAQLSILTIEDENLENGTFIVTLEPAKSSDQSKYSVSTSTNVTTVYASNLPVSNLYFVDESITISEEDGIATLKIATTFSQPQVLNVNFIPTDTSGDFLDETDGLSGERREIELNFELATNSGSNEDEDSNSDSIEDYKLNSEDDTQQVNDETTPLFIAELEIPIRDADGIYDEDGIISVELVESTGYSVDQSQISKAQILVEDVDIPELSLSSEVEAVAGGVTYLPVTADVTIRKILEVKYIATNEVGDFLDETAGDSGSERKVSLAFTQSETSSNAFASFPLNISYSEEFNTGRIEIELVEDKDVSKITYTIDSLASTTTIEVTRGAIPEIAILDPNITVDEDSSVAEISIEASIDPERALWVSYTPENTIGDFIAEIDENSETSRIEILRFTLEYRPKSIYFNIKG